MDDPLRVIRCVRFASRFGFEMVPELRAAAADLEIQVCLFDTQSVTSHEL
jgi:tRNA nucleotidyltransferase (CCA-adding enzyme)